MVQRYRNIYQIARESKGITQEKASELMDISVDSLRAYEGGKRIPPDKVVIKMGELYRNKFLYYQHFKITPLGEKYLPNIEIKTLAETVLTFLDECEDLERIRKIIIKIAKDNEIDEKEKSDWEKIKKEIKDVIIAGMSLIFM